VFDVQSTIERALFGARATSHPALATSINFVLLGVALLLRSSGARVSQRLLFYLSPLIALMALEYQIGHLIGPREPWFTSGVMPWHAALLFIVLSVALALGGDVQSWALPYGWAAMTVLAIGIALTLAARYWAMMGVQSSEARRFEEVSTEATEIVRRRMLAYIGALHAARGLFLANQGHVTRQQFSTYVTSLELSRHYPGFQGLGYSVALSPQQLDEHVRAVQREGFPEYRVWPDGDRAQYSAIVFLEPFDDRNQRAFGYDMRSDRVRRAAMDRARDTGQLAMTRGVVLVQEEARQPKLGFLLYLPVYRDSPRSVEERRDSLLGFVYSPFSATLLFRHIFASGAPNKLGFEVFDGNGALDPSSLLYDDDNVISASSPRHGSLTRDVRLPLADRVWTLHFEARPEFYRDFLGHVPTYVTLTGILLSLLLFAILHAQVRGRRMAEESLRARDTFLSIASHELKTPLTPLKLQVQSMLLARSGAASSSALTKKIEIIDRSVSRLDVMISNLLDVSRMSMGQLRLSPAPMDLTELVRDVVERTSAAAEQAGSVLTLHAEEPVRGVWDRMRLEQVVSNLLANAVKYGRGKPIDVSVREVDGRAVFMVRDHGIGIAKDDQRRIFNKFERAVSETHYGGFGIGLWIVAEIVHASGGTIRLESEPDQGATFSVSLPTDG
jgi:signal transduction histidine kinase